MTAPKSILDLLDLPPEASTVSRGIDALHVFVITVTMVSSTVVALIAFYFIVRYRRRSEAQLTPRVVAGAVSETLLIGGILTLFLVWWAIGYIQFVELETPPKDTMPIYVQAKQWMWKFTYADGRSANDTLTVPTGRAVKLVMTSRDVIHSFYVPAFRLKQDVVPGRYLTLWFQATTPGTYPIYCAEYCGVSHSMMRGNVVVLSPEAYEAWQSTPARDLSGNTDLVSEGERVAVRRGCVACHTVDGQPYLAPSLAGLYGSTVTLNDGRRVLADESYLTRSMMEPNADVVSGFKPIMPSYFGVLPQPEVAAIVEYVKSLEHVPPPGTSGVILPRLDINPQFTTDGGPPGGGVPAPPVNH